MFPYSILSSGVPIAYIEVNADLLSTNQSTGAGTSGALGGITAAKKKKHQLSASSDGILNKLRDMNFTIVGSKLNAEARRLEAAYDVGLACGLVSHARCSPIVCPRVATRLKLLHS